MGVKVVTFDVNETLRDLTGLDEPFEDVLGDRSLRGMVRPDASALLRRRAHGRVPRLFTSAQRGACLMIARRVGVRVSEQDAEAMRRS
jgi:hypothetical protein